MGCRWFSATSKIWERRESNPGLLGEKRKTCPLCYAASRQWQLNSSPISHFNSCLGSFQKFPWLKRESSSSSWAQNNQVFSTSAQFLAFQHFLRKPFRNFFLHLNKKFWAAKSFKFVSFLRFFSNQLFPPNFAPKNFFWDTFYPKKYDPDCILKFN